MSDEALVLENGTVSDDTEPPRILNIIKHVKKSLNKALQDPVNFDLLAQCLNTLSQILTHSPVLLTDEKIQESIPFYNVFGKIIGLPLDCSAEEQSKRDFVIQKVLDIVNVSEGNDEAKLAVANFAHPCLNLLADERRAIKIRLEISKLLNNVIESIPRENKDVQFQNVPFVKKFGELLIKAGDLELQLCMTELIFRMLPCEERPAHAQQWFQNHQECRDNFLAIRDSEFESDCRYFLNNLNERQVENRSVYSILCKEVYLGSFKVDCPNSADDNALFWTDFNLGSKTVSFFAVDKQNDSWETVTIDKTIVSKVKISDKNENKEVFVVFQLNQAAHNLLTLCDQTSEEKFVKFIYDEKNCPIKAARLLFPGDLATFPSDSPDVITSTPKTSVTSHAIHFSSRTKGLSNTVPLSTPRRRRSQGGSSDDSANSKHSTDPTKEKGNETSVPSTDDVPSGAIKDDGTEFKKPGLPEGIKKGGGSCSIPAQDSTSSSTSDTDSNAANIKQSTQRRRGGETRSTRNTDGVDKHNSPKANKKDVQKTRDSLNRASEMKKGVEMDKTNDSGLEITFSKTSLTIDNERGTKEHSVEDTGIIQDHPTVIHETQSLVHESQTVIPETQTGSQDVEDVSSVLDDTMKLIKDQNGELKSAKDNLTKNGKSIEEEDRSSEPFQREIESEKRTAKKKRSHVVEDIDQSSHSLQKESTKPKEKATETKGSEEGTEQSSHAFQKRTTRSKGKLSKVKVSEVEEETELSSHTFEKNTAKSKEKVTKTHQLRTRAAAKKTVSTDRNVSTSESEPPKKVKRPKTRTKNADDLLHKRNKLGSGYNTEDWMMGVSEPERRTEKQKALKRLEDKNVSKSRLALVESVFRERYKWDKFGKNKQLGPFEFKCSPPAKRTPQGKTLLRPARTAYKRKKTIELMEKKKTKCKDDSTLDVTMSNDQGAFSDIAREVRERNEVREIQLARQRKHHSEGELQNRTIKSQEKANEKVPSVGKDKNGRIAQVDDDHDEEEEEEDEEEDDDENKQEDDEVVFEENAIEVEATIPTNNDDLDTSMFDFDEHQIPVDTTNEPDNSFSGDESLSAVMQKFVDGDAVGTDMQADATNNQLEEEKKADGEESLCGEGDKTVMDDHESTNYSSKTLRETRARLNSSRAYPAKNFTRKDSKADSVKTRQKRKEEDESRARGKRNAVSDEHENRTRGKRSNVNKETESRARDERNSVSMENESRTRGSRNSIKEKNENRSRGQRESFDKEKGNDDFVPEETIERSPPRTRKKPIARKSVNDDVEIPLSPDRLSILQSFTKCFEKIVEDSDDYMNTTRKNSRTAPSRKHSETISKNKNSSKSSIRAQNREECWENDAEEIYNDDEQIDHSVSKIQDSLEKQDDADLVPFDFDDVNTPKVNAFRLSDSGIGKSASTSGRKKTCNKQDKTPGSTKSDAQNENPGTERKSRRFGRLDVRSSGCFTPLLDNDDKPMTQLEDAITSADEEQCNFFSRPSSNSQRRGKRKERDNSDFAFSKPGASKVEAKMRGRKKSSLVDVDQKYDVSAYGDLDGLDCVNNNDSAFKTPVDIGQSSYMEPRKLFHSIEHPMTKRRRRVLSHDDEDEDEFLEDDDFDDVVSVGVQKTLANLGNEMRRTIKKKQDYVSQMATATMKLVTGKSQEMFKVQSLRRNSLLNEFSNHVSKYINEHREITSRRTEVEDNMISQLKNHLDSMADHRREQEKCVRGIIRTQKSFTETFQKMEDTAKSQHADFQKSLRNELLRYRDEAAKDVQKQELGNIKRRIRAMLGTPL